MSRPPILSVLSLSLCLAFAVSALTSRAEARGHEAQLFCCPHPKEPTPYAGDCGPNPPPGYRYDLKGWRSGFDRDFSCYMLDEPE
ncbi:MAG: hypothetical protein ACR652_00345 [Methylocystis sp.]|uniref:hypothetical protein n=1 Tax=Methylocystis sp. TaxID=1911079 RepID=UPI003DA33D46